MAIDMLVFFSALDLGATGQGERLMKLVHAA